MTAATAATLCTSAFAQSNNKAADDAVRQATEVAKNAESGTTYGIYGCQLKW